MLQNKIFDQAAMVTNRVDCTYRVRIYITIYSVAFYFLSISVACVYFSAYASMENMNIEPSVWGMANLKEIV